MSSSDEEEESSPHGGSGSRVPQLAPGMSIGRYMVLELLGRGGMGQVYKAYDPELDRSIALKVINPPKSEMESASQASLRLMREAQALAQLSHPNVVAVHDVGKHEGAVYITMELVEGETARSWMRQGNPSRSEILGVFRQAGEGLLAAHEAGLVHRDFKPSNVIIGKDGRVRVADFGLVRSMYAPLPSQTDPRKPKEEDSEDEEIPDSGKYLSASLTMSKSRLGTPHYMSPEQFLRNPLDGRTDQYSFCVCLFEALYRQKPFQGRSLAELSANVMAGRRKEPADSTGVPEWLRSIILKGLARIPEERYPSMRELLGALAADPEEATRRAREARRRSLKHAGLGAVLASGLLLAGVLLSRDQELCRGGESLLPAVWNAMTRGKIRAAFADTGRSYAADTYRRVEGQLDRWAREWREMYTEACEATRVRGEQSEPVLDLRMACLQRKLGGLKVLLEVLGEKPDVAVMDKAVEASFELGGVGFCADVKALTQSVPPPEKEAARLEVENFRRRLEEVRVRHKLGRYEEAGSLLGKLRAGVEALAYRPLVGEFRLQECENLDSRGKYAEAEAAGQEALQIGLEVRDMDLSLRAAQELTGVVGVRMDRHQEGLWYARIAIGLSEGLGDEREALTNLQVGSVFYRQGKYAEAEAAYQRVIELHGRMPGLDHANGSTARDTVGADHIDLSTARNNLGAIRLAQGRVEEAVTEFQRAIAIREKALGLDHPEVAALKNNLGSVFWTQRRFEEAEAEFRQALSRFVEALGPEHPYAAAARANVALSLRGQGKLDEAMEELRRALAISEKAVGKRHPNIVEVRNNLAEVLMLAGKLEEAEAEYRLALEIGQETLGSDHPFVAESFAGLGKVLFQKNRQTKARSHLERAIEIFEKAKVARDKLAETCFWLARSLWMPPQDRDRARALAKKAKELYMSSGKPYDPERHEVERWLDEHQ